MPTPTLPCAVTRRTCSYLSGLIDFRGAEFELGDSNARGAASDLQISQAGTLHLGGVNYTTCPPNSNDWLLEAGSIDLDTNEGTGQARNVKLRFKGVPILYAPFFFVSIGQREKDWVSDAGVSVVPVRSGNEIAVPVYWNIRENYDATFTPRWLSDRGIQLGSEFRYLTRRNDGIAIFDILPNDGHYRRKPASRRPKPPYGVR